MECPFCKINEKKTKVLREEDSYYVALSNPRLMPGHLLVIPKRHVERGSQLNKEEREEIIRAVFKLQDEIVEKLAEGCDIRSNYRPFIKQGRIKVDHFHFHLQPRELKDELYKRSQKQEKELFKGLPKEEAEKFAKMFGK